MILIFGGTTEGRKAVQVVDQAGKPFYYSTKGELQVVHSANGIRLTGAMDGAHMKRFCAEHAIRLLVDAAHPFAEQLHRTIAGVSEELQIPVIRFERIYPPRDPDVVWCEEYADAIRKMEQHGVERLLALTGVNTLAALRPFWTKRFTRFRILRREESMEIVRREGFPPEQLLFYELEGSPEKEAAAVTTLLCSKEEPIDAILTKESGISGGFIEKCAAARQAGIRLYAIQHPSLPGAFHSVNGEHGLRRAIEQLMPGFYPLRTGVTTGACATAGAVAALRALLTGEVQTDAAILLPNGETITLPVGRSVCAGGCATATVIKDSGDDADITNGTAIEVTVAWGRADGTEAGKASTPTSPTILLKGGKGVGTVTLPGLGLPVGGAAINAGPQKMICENLLHTFSSLPRGCKLPAEAPVTLEVTISVPEGELLAARTFNPRLGIVGGISIIGTSGIVQPFSVEAFIASIRKSLEVAQASGSPRIVINSGAKSERYLRNHYPHLPETAFVQYGNFIGETLKMAAALNLGAVSLGVMIGKAVKLAEGHLDTHSKKTTMNRAFLRQLAREVGCCEDTLAAIDRITLARELWTVLPPQEAGAFFQRLVALCHRHCSPLLPQGELTVHLIRETGEVYTPV